ncbi:SLAP domain-containing protein [Companilactobacillus baiquanensis]|uniref:SLAP domain-containing protein n=1 Tax=Companilactobacillus baiquanensis TaxID=2486005 RepID=A0ABW1UVS2_9LACO|nr:SLAP domain-containing protein [Companilactobacillus baiquanensis]
MQLKHISNKKLFAISLLSFSSGLALFGSVNVANADTVGDESNQSSVSEVGQTNNAATKVQSNPSTSNKTDDNVDTNNESNVNQGTKVNNNSDSTETSAPVQTSANSRASISQAVAQAPVSNNNATTASDATAQAPVQSDATNSTNFEIPEGTPADQQGTLQGENGEVGSSWYLADDGITDDDVDNGKVLNIGPGIVGNPIFDDTTKATEPDSDGVWANYKYAGDITSIDFQKGAIAGTSLAKYFGDLQSLININTADLDVSNTTDFSSMFLYDKSLKSLDISNWTNNKGATFNSFAQYCGFENVNLSGVSLTNISALRMFAGDGNLTNIDFDGASISVANAGSMFSEDENLKSVDLTVFTIPFGTDVDGMLGDLSGLRFIKVNKDTIIDSTLLDVDEMSPSEDPNWTSWTGWTNEGGFNLFVTDKELFAAYDGTGTNPEATTTTLRLTSDPAVSYTVNYYDDSTKKLLGKLEGTGIEGGVLPLNPDYEGYETTVTDGSTSVTLSPEDGTSNIIRDFYLKPIPTNNGGGSNSSGSSTSTTLKDQDINTTTNVVNLYDANGKLVTNRGLSINSSWKSDVEYYSNGVLYYRVSSDEYVKASDVYVYTDNLANIKVNADQKGDLVDYLGAELDRKLGSGSEWKTDKIALINGKKYYRVSTDEFILADEVAEY